MCFDYDDIAECSQSSKRKSRKDHRCDCCNAITIHRGDIYEYRSGIFDGGPFSEKICRRCLYDISRIVDDELTNDCSWHTSWPALDDVHDYLIDSKLGMTDLDAVPADFDYSDWYALMSKSYIERMRGSYASAGLR